MIAFETRCCSMGFLVWHVTQWFKYISNPSLNNITSNIYFSSDACDTANHFNCKTKTIPPINKNIPLALRAATRPINIKVINQRWLRHSGHTSTTHRSPSLPLPISTLIHRLTSSPVPLPTTSRISCRWTVSHWQRRDDRRSLVVLLADAAQYSSMYHANVDYSSVTSSVGESEEVNCARSVCVERLLVTWWILCGISLSLRDNWLSRSGQKKQRSSHVDCSIRTSISFLPTRKRSFVDDVFVLFLSLFTWVCGVVLVFFSYIIANQQHQRIVQQQYVHQNWTRIGTWFYTSSFSLFCFESNTLNICDLLGQLHRRTRDELHTTAGSSQDSQERQWNDHWGVQEVRAWSNKDILRERLQGLSVNFIWIKQEHLLQYMPQGGWIRMYVSCLMHARIIKTADLLESVNKGVYL